MPENTLTLDNLEEGFQLSKADFNFFYDMDPSITGSLKLKQTGKKDRYDIEPFLEK